MAFAANGRSTDENGGNGDRNRRANADAATGEVPDVCVDERVRANGAACRVRRPAFLQRLRIVDVAAPRAVGAGMTPLDRRWVESEWRAGYSPGFEWRDPQHDLTVWMEVWPRLNGCYSAALHISECMWLFGPFTRSLREAKSDAEAMYRQWVYDEYGVVLP
jgi:hypothetical protein